jgi:hypothetical protein
MMLRNRTTPQQRNATLQRIRYAPRGNTTDRERTRRNQCVGTFPPGRPLPCSGLPQSSTPTGRRPFASDGRGTGVEVPPCPPLAGKVVARSTPRKTATLQTVRGRRLGHVWRYSLARTCDAMVCGAFLRLSRKCDNAGISTSAPTMFHKNMKVSRMPISA